MSSISGVSRDTVKGRPSMRRLSKSRAMPVSAPPYTPVYSPLTWRSRTGFAPSFRNDMGLVDPLCRHTEMVLCRMAGNSQRHSASHEGLQHVKPMVTQSSIINAYAVSRSQRDRDYV